MLSEALKESFGTKVYKLSLTSGCTCPNRDGRISYGGCSFCSEGGSGEFAAPLLPLGEQIRLARQLVDKKIPARIPLHERKYIAYFQSFTNTYARSEQELLRLRQLYMEAVRRPDIAALSLGTRPDCLPPRILQMLRELRAFKHCTKCIKTAGFLMQKMQRSLLIYLLSNTSFSYFFTSSNQLWSAATPHCLQYSAQTSPIGSILSSS